MREIRAMFEEKLADKLGNPAMPCRHGRSGQAGLRVAITGSGAGGLREAHLAPSGRAVEGAWMHEPRCSGSSSYLDGEVAVHMAEAIDPGHVAATLMVCTENGPDSTRGTAFLVVRPDDYNHTDPEKHNWEGSLEEGWRIWIVTCAHVVDDIEAAGGKTLLRMNEEEPGGGITSIAMPVGHWTRHPEWKPLWRGEYERPYRISDADHDVAVAIAPTHYDHWSSLFQGAWPAHWQLNRALMEHYELYEGSSALVMGFPEGGWYEGRRDWPLVRSGTIAQVRPYLRENMNTFLIDGNIFAGNSGGPVVADVGAAKRIGATAYPRHRLMGMVCAAPISGGAENAGLGVVVSVEKINEAIDEALRIGIPGTVKAE